MDELSGPSLSQTSVRDSDVEPREATPSAMHALTPLCKAREDNYIEMTVVQSVEYIVGR